MGYGPRLSTKEVVAVEAEAEAEAEEASCLVAGKALYYPFPLTAVEGEEAIEGVGHHHHHHLPCASEEEGWDQTLASSLAVEEGAEAEVVELSD